MKTTLMHRQTIANPRRTTLAHLKDASELLGGAAAAGSDAGSGEGAQAGAVPRVLPSRTANPRRTVLTELPPTTLAP
ncbi:hypothetical protein [Streptomyces sp. HPF1205]|uniref:hypothetical protein n=1 Tax=Streptomyces sp. HPF1205 TaxID=2873262 RepID=UPI001CED5FDA|nr:hypothetical protein [Streptomyces sp. HPF1205]